MNWPLEISICPFLTVSSLITSSCFPEDFRFFIFWFLFLILFFFTYSSAVWTQGENNNFSYLFLQLQGLNLGAVSYLPLLSLKLGLCSKDCDRLQGSILWLVICMGHSMDFLLLHLEVLRWQKTGLKGLEGVLCSEFDFCPEHLKWRSCSFSIFGIKDNLQLLWSLQLVQSFLADVLCGLYTLATHKGRKERRGFLHCKAKRLFGFFRIISNVNQLHDFHPVPSVLRSVACVKDAKHLEMMTGKEKSCIWLKHS